MNKRERRNNRNRWRLVVKTLAEHGWLGGESMYYGEQDTNNTPDDPKDILWENPKEDKTPVSKPCTTCSRCSHCGAHHEKLIDRPVYVAPKVWAKIRLMMTRFTQHEWGGYFIADDGGVFVDLIIPKQVGRTSTWQADPGAAEGLTIAGVIHSHVRMGVFHSGVDDDNLIANHPVSVVVSRKHDDSLEFEAVRSVPQECGALYRYKTGVHFALPDENEWLEEAVSNVRMATTGVLVERPTAAYNLPMGVHAGRTTYVGLCDRARWCYRDKGHDGPCSENREHYLCRKTKTKWCLLVDGHTGHCSSDGSPKDKKNVAGLNQSTSYSPSSAWTATNDHKSTYEGGE